MAAPVVPVAALGSPVAVQITRTVVAAWPVVVATHTQPDSAWPNTVAVVATHTQPDAWPNSMTVVATHTLPDSVAVLVTHILAVFAVVATGPWKLGPGCAPSP